MEKCGTNNKNNTEDRAEKLTCGCAFPWIDLCVISTAQVHQAGG